MNDLDIGGLSLRLSNGRPIDLCSGLTLTATDLPGLHSTPLGGPVALVKPHPVDPNIWGLQNLSHLPWHVRLPNGDSIEVKPGKNVRLAPGTRINFGSIQGDIELTAGALGSPKPKPLLWIGIAGVALCLVAAGGWYFEHHVASEKARREQIVREGQEQRNREDAQKREQEERAVKLQKEHEAAATQRAEQEQARALAEAAKTPAPSPTPPREFDGTWIVDRPSFGFYFSEHDKINAKKMRIGSFRATLVITNGETASFVVEFFWRLSQGSTKWFDMPAPFNTTSQRYQKYTTQSLELGTTDSALSVFWDQWKLVEWRPKKYPRSAFESQAPAELPVQRMLFRLTGPDELTSADLVFHRAK